MWGEPGHLYVYLSHGIHSCVNVVCGPEGAAGGVLLRGGEVAGGPPHARVRARIGDGAGARAVVGLDLGEAHRDGGPRHLAGLPVEVAPRLLGGMLQVTVAGATVAVRLTEVEGGRPRPR
jgi:3-methyladenine DNA glycosylase Mpg